MRQECPDDGEDDDEGECDQGVSGQCDGGAGQCLRSQDTNYVLWSQVWGQCTPLLSHTALQSQ